MCYSPKVRFLCLYAYVPDKLLIQPWISVCTPQTPGPTTIELHINHLITATWRTKIPHVKTATLGIATPGDKVETNILRAGKALTLAPLL